MVRPEPEIVQVAERVGLKLQQRGKGFWALCPFHEEKTPSFSVTPEKQRWHCFGCGKSGDVIDLVRALKGFSYGEALSYLGLEGKRQQRQEPEAKRRNVLVGAFNQWCRDEYDFLCGEYRCLSGMTRHLRTDVDLAFYGDIFPELTEMEYHLDVLQHGSDEERFELFKEIYNGF